MLPVVISRLTNVSIARLFGWRSFHQYPAYRVLLVVVCSQRVRLRVRLRVRRMERRRDLVQCRSDPFETCEGVGHLIIHLRRAPCLQPTAIRRCDHWTSCPLSLRCDHWTSCPLSRALAIPDRVSRESASKSIKAFCSSQ